MDHDHIHDLCLRMEDIAFRAGLRRFDRVKYKTALDELWFLWEEEKQLVIVELTASPEQMAAALAGTMTGDPALN